MKKVLCFLLALFMFPTMGNSSAKINLQDYINSRKIKTLHITPYDFVKYAVYLNNAEINDEIINEKEILNKLWRINKTQTNNSFFLKNIIPIIDTSHRMNENCLFPLYSAIGMAIRLSEMSYLKNMIYCYGNLPLIVQFKNNDTFTDKVNKIFDAYNDLKIGMGMGNDFYSILHGFVSQYASKITNIQFDTLGFVLFSDMQIDPMSINNEYYLLNTMDDNIKMIFNEKNIGKQHPGFILWNMKKTTGFPINFNKSNIHTMSGYQFKLLNKIFTDKHFFINKNGKKSKDKTFFLNKKEMTNWDRLLYILNNNRYKPMNDFLL